MIFKNLENADNLSLGEPTNSETVIPYKYFICLPNKSEDSNIFSISSVIIKILNEICEVDFKIRMRTLIVLSMAVLALLLAACNAALASEDVNAKTVTNLEYILSGDTAVYLSEAVSNDGAEYVENTALLDRLPVIFRESIKILNYSEKEKNALVLLIEGHVTTGKNDEASRVLGSAFGIAQKHSLPYLGFYCTRILPFFESNLEDKMKFLGGFVRGYGKSGILVLTNEGIKTVRAFGRRRGTQWKIVPAGSFPEDKFDRIYKGRDLVFIPFAAGEIFLVDLSGAANGKAQMWKILSKGINFKCWQGGAWEREITVRGDKVYKESLIY